ncbi:MAG: hypothetical protein WBF08_05090 [Candidatus Bathyarchaeia archaeon]
MSLKSVISPNKIRKVQRLVSILVLLGMTLALAPYISSGVEMPEEKPLGATRLLITHEGYQVELDKPWKLYIKAINDQGLIDTSRDDFIEIDVKSISYMESRSEISAKSLRLQNGTATIIFLGHAQELVSVTANWKEGKSELKSGMVTLHVGIGGE